MLVTLDKIRQQVAGKHPAIDAWLNVRRNLLVEYMQLAGLMPPTARPCQAARLFLISVADW